MWGQSIDSGLVYCSWDLRAAAPFVAAGRLHDSGLHLQWECVMSKVQLGSLFSAAVNQQQHDTRAASQHWKQSWVLRGCSLHCT